jgi:hypothetical protein
MAKKSIPQHGWIVLLDGERVGSDHGWPCRGEPIWATEPQARSQATKLRDWGTVTIEHV